MDNYRQSLKGLYLYKISDEVEYIYSYLLLIVTVAIYILMYIALYIRNTRYPRYISVYQCKISDRTIEGITKNAVKIYISVTQIINLDENNNLYYETYTDTRLTILFFLTSNR